MGDLGSWRLKGEFDLSKSPYYRSLFPGQKRAFSSTLQYLYPSLSQRHKLPTFSQSTDRPSFPPQHKSEQRALSLLLSQQRAAQISATRLQLEEVTGIQLETVKQRKREEAVKALMQKKREIAERKAESIQKINRCRSEVLEEKRVFFR